MAKRAQDMFVKDPELGDERSQEERSLAMRSGGEDEDIYDEDGAAELRDDDEIEDWEEGFMEGASGAGKSPFCAHCGKELSDSKHCVERVIDGKHYVFCGSVCAGKGLRS